MTALWRGLAEPSGSGPSKSRLRAVAFHTARASPASYPALDDSNIAGYGRGLETLLPSGVISN